MINLSTVELLGVKICTQSVESIIELISQTVIRRERAILAYVNVHAMNLAQELPWFRDFLNQATVTYCDGYGVKWGAQLQGLNIPHRFTPPDWFPNLASTCAGRGFSLYFLGARPGVAEKCAARLREKNPGLRVVGTQHGYFDKTRAGVENQAVLQSINAAYPDILVIGLGMPIQERWLVENWDQVNAFVALPVGAMFDYLTDEIQRAPRWMTDHGLEWFGRLFFEPRRLARRYLVGNPRFFWRILKYRFSESWIN